MTRDFLDKAARRGFRLAHTAERLRGLLGADPSDCSTQGVVTLKWA